MSKDYHCSLFPYERFDFLSIQEIKQESPWSITSFNLPDAWKHTQGEGVTIAVMDTGCDLDHDDLQENLLQGKNFVDVGKPPHDDNGHGTHITGILVAANNEIGVVGVAPKAKVIPVKVLDGQGNGNLLTVAAGIRWCIDKGVDLISLSLGAPSPVQQVRKSIQAAAEAGIVTFCAAGNAGNTTEIFFPGAYPEVISIGAIDPSMRRAAFSNTGKRLDFMAPGVDVLSTVPDNWYAKLSGTSMAQPFACGVAALLLSYIKHRPHSNISLKTADEYRNFLKKYTIPIEGENYADPHFYQGFGIIDPRKLVEAFNLGMEIPGI